MHLSSRSLVLIVFSSVVLFALFSLATSPSLSLQEKTLIDFPSDFQIEIASSSEARVRGLSGREHIPHNYGMLFVFTEPGRPAFWMKDMLVPIDIIWLLDDGTIVGIEHEVTPQTYPTTFSPPVPVRYVLEVQGGEARSLGWEVGTRLPLPTFW